MYFYNILLKRLVIIRVLPVVCRNFIYLSGLVRQCVIDAYQDICLMGLRPWFLPINTQPCCYNLVDIISNFKRIQTLPNKCGYPTASPSSPIPCKKSVAIHLSTLVMRTIPPCFGDSYVIAFLLQNGFQLLLFLASTAYVGILALQLSQKSCHFFFVKEALIPA